MSDDIPKRAPAAVAWWHRIPGDVRAAALATATVTGALAMTDARPTPLRAVGPRPLVDAVGGALPAVPAVAHTTVAVLVAFVTLVLLHRLARSEALPAVADRAVWLAALTTIPGAALGDPVLLAAIAATLAGAVALRHDRPLAGGLALAGATLLAAPAAAAIVFAVVAIARPRGPQLRSLRAAAAIAAPITAVAALVAWDVHHTGATPHRSLAAIALGPGTPHVPWQPAVDAMAGRIEWHALGALAVAAALVVGPRRHAAARLHGVALALAVASGLIAGPVALVAAPIGVLVAADLLDRSPGLERPLLVILALWLVH